MSYREEGNSVILTMSREDYDAVLEVLRRPVMFIQTKRLKRYQEFLDRLNQGNPHYTPYQTGEK